MQRWGCQALVPLFGDPVVAAPFRQAGIAAVVRALAMLQDVETALKSMGAVSASGKVGAAGRGAGSGGGSGAGGGGTKPTEARKRWARAMKKVQRRRVLRCTRSTRPGLNGSWRVLRRSATMPAFRIMSCK